MTYESAVAAAFIITTACVCDVRAERLPCVAQKELMDTTIPAVLNIDSAKITKAQWKDVFLKSYGAKFVQVAHPSYVVISEGVPTEKMMLRDFYDVLSGPNRTGIVTFGADLPLESTALRDNIKRPPALEGVFQSDGKQKIRPILSLGAESTGLPFHSHGGNCLPLYCMISYVVFSASWLQVLYGRKEWLLYPPGHMPVNLQHQWMSPNQQWEQASAQNDEKWPMYCVQGPSQVSLAQIPTISHLIVGYVVLQLFTGDLYTSRMASCNKESGRITWDWAAGILYVIA